ncbi:hypothetical protein TTHERM_00190840 (macronuclear) [Tetrahymena thermophila SB210]|uniref:Uncharacterized protein n=1 Tax=Tetrahymena thermophila (strain SB210) TaxID=312017 RepID=I7LV06_TETTS|nr:hypothetical protein TTHERM_00190840 [Tetrahymena thermophila SB210]EAR96416.2 hypothetical protein TTHERM_00190840 [Tetrahymena thermophila SB210]|eukprot:XP_001016661.2 hypothetical protein TTHERM_00190840 [Tetrahymena thermophila SB210]
MYKRIQQKIKDADYERDMQEVLEIMNDKREQYLKSKNIIEADPEEPQEQQYEEKQIKVSTCRLCKQNFKATQAALNNHLLSGLHQQKLVEYKKRYSRYLYQMKRLIFKNRLSVHNKLSKLKYFRLAYQFE